MFRFRPFVNEVSRHVFHQNVNDSSLVCRRIPTAADQAEDTKHSEERDEQHQDRRKKAKSGFEWSKCVHPLFSDSVIKVIGSTAGIAVGLNLHHWMKYGNPYGGGKACMFKKVANSVSDLKNAKLPTENYKISTYLPNDILQNLHQWFKREVIKIYCPITLILAETTDAKSTRSTENQSHPSLQPDKVSKTDSPADLNAFVNNEAPRFGESFVDYKATVLLTQAESLIHSGLISHGIRMLRAATTDGQLEHLFVVKGSAQGHYNLGVIYQRGDHSLDRKPDLIRARTHYILAKKNGHNMAERNLRNLEAKLRQRNVAAPSVPNHIQTHSSVTSKRAPVH